MLSLRRVLLLIASLTVTTAIVAPLGLIGAALYTTAGLEFVVRHIPHRFAGVRLDIVGVSGTVASGLQVERVEIDHELVHLKFEGITGKVALMPLMLQTIRATHATVQSALIEVRRRTRPSTPGAPPFLPAWLIISAEQVHVGHATLTVAANGFRMEGTDLDGAAVLRHRVIRFFQAEGLIGNTARASAIGEIRATDPFGMDVQGHLEWHLSAGPPWTVAGSARGDLSSLALVAQATRPLRASFVGRGLDLTEHWRLTGVALVQDFDLREFGGGGAFGGITGRLAVTGDTRGFSAHGALTPTGLRAGPFDAQFSGRYAAGVLTAQRIELRHPGSGALLRASGSIGTTDARLDLTGEVSDFRWPLPARDPAVSGASGTVTLRGTLPYRVEAKGSAGAAGLPPMPLELAGTLGRESLTFDRAEIDLLGGHASLTGEVAWSPNEQWSVSGRATGINPDAWREDLPGSLNFNLAASGRGFDARGELSFAFSNLRGKLRGVAASGSGTLTHAADTWGFNAVRVALGSTHLALDGELDERLDLRFAVATTDLNLLAAGMRGELKASGTVRGTRAEPAIAATANGAALDYQGIRLEGLDADVDFDPGAGRHDSRIEARLHGLSYHARTFESVVLELSGPPDDYALSLEATATGLTAKAQAHGAYVRGDFSGSLDSVTVSGSEALRLALERPVGLTAGPARARLEWLCLVGTPGSLCADGEWSRTGWTTTVMTNQLPIKTLTAGMTPTVEYLGTVSALARLASGAGTSLVGTLRAELADAELVHKLASRHIEHTRIGSGTVALEATPGLLTASLELGDGDVGTVQGRLEAQRAGHGDVGQWPDMPLSGELHAQTSELGLISIYVPDIDRAAGHFNADLKVSGTVGEPLLDGLIKVSDGEIDFYQVNLALRQVSLDAHVSDAGLDFEGSAHAGAGSVSAGGHLEWRALLPYGRFHLRGTNLRVADVPEAQIDASPDLDFSVNGRRIEVTGTVTVPYARIQPKDFAGAMRASPDEVLVGHEEEEPGKRLEVMSTITLALGERVSIDTSGLTGRLTGNITIKSGYEATTRATGELSVADGKYTAYARKLDIERGRLLFTGGPIDDPGIDVRAVKTFPDVKAGVNVRGTLLAPRLSFFSDPPLPQSQIMSLILAGGSLQSAQNASNAALGQGAALLAAQIGGRVGIPDVSLETDPIANETSLVLGRYLSPRLYVSYGVSLTEQLNTFKLRYTLGDHWTVRTEMGQARGADLVFTVEK